MDNINIKHIKFLNELSELFKKYELNLQLNEGAHGVVNLDVVSDGVFTKIASFDLFGEDDFTSFSSDDIKKVI